jgi:hypothetical protein
MASDDGDVQLGRYFQNCREDIIAVTNAEIESGQPLMVESIPNINCNNAYLNIKYEDLKEVPFVWVSFSHGNENSIKFNGMALVSVGDDNSLFKNTFFYTNSCLSGKSLGPDLISQKCRVFIGYDKSIIAFKNENQDISLKCDTIGIISFLTSDLSAYGSFLEIRQFYTQQANRLLDFGDPLSSALLINAREALVFHGDKEVKKENLFFQE